MRRRQQKVPAFYTRVVREDVWPKDLQAPGGAKGRKAYENARENADRMHGQALLPGVTARIHAPAPGDLLWYADDPGWVYVVGKEPDPRESGEWRAVELFGYRRCRILAIYPAPKGSADPYAMYYTARLIVPEEFGKVFERFSYHADLTCREGLPYESDVYQTFARRFRQVSAAHQLEELAL